MIERKTNHNENKVASKCERNLYAILKAKPFQ